MEDSGRGVKVGLNISTNSQIFWLVAESDKDFLRVRGLSLRLVRKGRCKEPRSDIKLFCSQFLLVELVVL